MAPTLLAEGFLLADAEEDWPDEVCFTKSSHGIQVLFFEMNGTTWLAVSMPPTSGGEAKTVLEAEARTPIHARALLWAMGLIGANRPGTEVANGT